MEPATPPTPDPTQNTPEPPTTVKREFLKHGINLFGKLYGMDWLVEDMSDQVMSNKSKVRIGRFLCSLSVTILVAVGLGFFIKGCQRDDRVETEKETSKTWENLSRQNETEAKRYKNDRDDVDRKNTFLERSNATLVQAQTSLEARLTTYEQRANIQVPSNTPPDRRIDAILEQLKLLGGSANDFSFKVNGVEPSDQSPVHIGENRNIEIEVKNLSSGTAENLYVTFAPFANETNFIYAGWDVRGRVDSLPGAPVLPALETKSDASIGGGDRFITRLQVSTNYSNPVLRARLSVRADRSNQRVIFINFALSPK